MPPRLKPVETMANARPAAPGGAALRTSMSREGAITPPRKPASPIAAVSTISGQADQRNHQHDRRIDRKTRRGHLGVYCSAAARRSEYSASSRSP